MNRNEPSSGIAPLTPADCDLQDFQYMPLDVRRLRDSDLAAMESPEACWAAVLLWSASWHQVPAGSLPDDDRVLANLAGYGRVVKEWKRVKDGALRGWVKCEDGRLYHPVVAEKALEAWDSKLHHAHGKLKERLRKSHGKDATQPTFDQWISAGKPSDWPQPSGVNEQDSAGKENSSAGIPPENALKGEGKGEGSNYSEANASGGEPPKITDPNEIIFGYGVPLLTNAGTAEKQARSFLGGLRKTYGDQALIDKLRDCIREKPLQPLEWLAAALPPTGQAKAGSRHAGFDKIDYRAGVTADGRF